MTYLLLDTAFLVPVLVIAVVAGMRAHVGGRSRGLRLILVATVLVLLTAVFDNLLVGLGIVAYHSDRITGVRVGAAPIEDFAYALAAVLLLPALWTLLPARRSGSAASAPAPSSAGEFHDRRPNYGGAREEGRRS